MIKFKLSYIIILISLILIRYFYGNIVINCLILSFFLIFTFSLISLFFSKKYLLININLQDTKVFVGDNIKIYFYINNKSPFLYSSIRFLFKFTGMQKKFDKNFSAAPFNKVKRELILKINTRGVYTSRDCLVDIHDLFSIASKKLNLEDKFTITVYPQIVQLPLETEEFINNTLKISTNADNLYSSDTYSYIDKFSQGDNIKNIHWKLSAKKNDLYIKKFEKTQQDDIDIYIDMNDYSFSSSSFQKLEEENLISFSLALIKHLLIINKIIYLNIENSQNITFKLNNINDYDSVLLYYLHHKSSGKNDFFNKTLLKRLDANKTNGIVFIITYTIANKDVNHILKLSYTCQLLIIFTITDINPSIKSILSNIKHIQINIQRK